MIERDVHRGSENTLLPLEQIARSALPPLGEAHHRCHPPYRRERLAKAGERTLRAEADVQYPEWKHQTP
jgi:hypothetical protein